MVRRGLCALLLALALVPIIPMSQAQAPILNLRLYAHTDHYLGAPQGRLLSTAPPYGDRQFAIVDRPFAFYLYPPTPKGLRIEGTLQFEGWFKVAEACEATITVTFLEIRKGVQEEFGRISATNLPMDTKVSPRTLAVGHVSRLIPNGSAIGISVVVQGCGLPLLYWDGRDTPTSVVLPLVNPDFSLLNVRALDYRGAPIAGANVTVTQRSLRVWTGITNSTGWASIYLLAVERPSLYNLSAYLFGNQVNVTRNLRLPMEAPLLLRSEAYELKGTIVGLGIFPIPGATIRLLDERSALVASANASSDGSFLFRQLPKAKYTLEVTAEGGTNAFQIEIRGPLTGQYSLAQPPRYVWNWLLVIAAVGVGGVGLFSTVKRRRPRNFDFGFFKRLVGGGIPSSSIVMVTGNSGAGKTVVLEHLANEGVADGRPCLFVTNVDFPHRIRQSMKDFGMDASNKVLFIDCYSAMAGTEPKEELSLQHPNDLTALGVQVTSSLTRLGRDTDVFLDSLGPMIDGQRAESLVAFIHSIGARVRGNNGRFFFSVGRSAPRGLLSRLEETSDCVIEIDVSEHKGQLKRKMRVKKLKGEFIDRWIDFSVRPKAGVVFHARESILKSLASRK